MLSPVVHLTGAFTQTPMKKIALNKVLNEKMLQGGEQTTTRTMPEHSEASPS